jgi:hypothetical protein
MKRAISILILMILTVITFNSLGYAQATKVIGKLYTKVDANQIYGKVNTSVTVNTSTILQAMDKSPDYLMFNIINGHLIILNGQRTVLYSTNLSITSVSKSTVFHKFSVSKIKELISTGGNNAITTVELRNNDVLTATNGTETIEGGILCPPNC